ncbi:LysR family transcriptional regulator [Ralstonia pseudosolanacearum]|uniref:LysR family transcriptional regulator n=1 Tax=Ralstonia pseudosolanacearum TaxID=1310165 RepID=UPI001FFB19F0|nr:LysR family transcriptional regulator [Ralstonia pseudosolanacearum]
MNVTLRQLRVFLAVARAHNFSRAGDTIGLTQPAVSRSISELEGELALKLLDRTTREVVLTEVGRSLATALERLVADLDDTLHQARQVGEQRRGRVVVASSPTVSTRLMPLYVAECAKRYPDIRMIVRDSVQVDTLQLIRGGGADFGVVIEPLDTEGLWTEPLLTDPFCLVCRRDHPFARRGSVRWKELHRTAIVLLDHASGSRPLLDRIFLRHGVQPDVAQEMGHTAAVFGMVEAGIGAGVVPALSLPLPSSSQLVSVPLAPRETRGIVLARRHDRSLSPAAEAAWQMIRRMALPAG